MTDQPLEVWVFVHFTHEYEVSEVWYFDVNKMPYQLGKLLEEAEQNGNDYDIAKICEVTWGGCSLKLHELVDKPIIIKKYIETTESMRNTNDRPAT